MNGVHRNATVGAGATGEADEAATAKQKKSGDSTTLNQLSTEEISAVADLRTLHAACQSYHELHKTFPQNLKVLAEDKPPWISEELGNSRGSLSGYYYFYSLIDKDHFEIFATGEPGKKKFYIDQDGSIKLEGKFGQVIE